MFAALLCIAVSCGKKGAPYPPEPRGPGSVTALSARQIGNRIEVACDLPQSKGDKHGQQLTRVELVRVTFAPGRETPPDSDVFRRRGERVNVAQGDPLVAGVRIRLADERLADLGADIAGSTLRYAVRVLDRRGRSSPLVVAVDLVPEPSAAAPRGLSAEPTADGMRVAWTGPPFEEGRSYNLYRSSIGDPEPEQPLNPEPLTVTEYLDDQVVSGERYRYFVRVSLAAGLPRREGETSEVREVLARDVFPPSPPSGLVAVQEGDGVRLFWDPGPERDLAGYRVYRRQGEDGAWNRIGPDPVERPLYLDAEVSAGQRWSYHVTAIDRAEPPNESEPSSDALLDVVDEPTVPRGERP
jgi:hypothetical protein